MDIKGGDAYPDNRPRFPVDDEHVGLPSVTTVHVPSHEVPQNLYLNVRKVLQRCFEARSDGRMSCAWMALECGLESMEPNRRAERCFLEGERRPEDAKQVSRTIYWGNSGIERLTR